MRVLGGPVTAAEERLAALPNRTATTVELAVVACLHMDVCTTLGRAGRAVAVCLDYLRQLVSNGRPIRRRRKCDANTTASDHYLRTGASRISSTYRRWRMPNRFATLEVLSKVNPSAWYTDWNLAARAVCKAATLSLERGNCGASCVAYVLLGRIAGPRFGDYQTGFRFGQLGYELVERRGLKRFQASTYLCFVNFVVPWTKHVRACRDLLRRAFDAANQVGDLVMGAGACSALNSYLLFAGDPLPDVQGEAERGLAFAEKARFGFVIDLITTQLALIRMLRGMTRKFGYFDDGQFNEVRAETHLSSRPALASAACWHWIRKLQARYLAGDYAAAIGRRIEGATPAVDSPRSEKAEYHFYAALAAAAYATAHRPASGSSIYRLSRASQSSWRSGRRTAPRISRTVPRWSVPKLPAWRGATSMPDASTSRPSARRAPMASSTTRRSPARRPRDFYAARGFEPVCRPLRAQSPLLLLALGRHGKVRQLDARHPSLATTDAHGGGRAPPSPDQPIDVAAVVKASQTLSGEMLLPRLIERLMTIALQHAGAERGLLILVRDGEPRIEAEATTGPGKIEVAVRHAV